MKHSKFKNIIVVILFVIILILPAVIYWIQKDRFTDLLAQEKNKVSELYEGRFRTYALPFLSEKLMSPWYKKVLEEKAAKEKKEKEKMEQIDPILVGVPSIPEGLPYLAPTVQEDVIIGRNNWLFIDQVDSVNYFLGNSILSDAEMAEWKYSFERLQTLLEERGVKVAFVIGPDKEQVYPEYMPTYEINSEYKRQILFEKYMKDNSFANYYYPIRELAAYKGQFDTYYMADTHWNEVGGLIAVSDIYKAFDLPLNKSDYRAYTEKTKYGDVGWVTGNSVEYTDYRIEYKKDISVSEEVWDENRDIDYNVKTVTSSNKNGKRLFVIGDSFRVAPLKIMQKDFETVEVMHRNNVINGDYNVLETIRSINEGDCVAFIGVERFDDLLKEAVDIVYNELVSY